MRKIILASKSKARRRLLRQIGLKFTMAESRVKERRVLNKSARALVIENALRKAKDIARRSKKGIVVAADTVALANGKIIGKPKSLKEAFKALKLLSRRPEWVYTGLAVIDTESGRIFTDYEKTKVYMIPMSEDEIRNYLKKTPPFDKAGSFDIQGLGGALIDRIEGCFYNVVGLPLSKLAKILKKLGVDIFL